MCIVVASTGLVEPSSGNQKTKLKDRFPVQRKRRVHLYEQMIQSYCRCSPMSLDGVLLSLRSKNPYDDLSGKFLKRNIGVFTFCFLCSHPDTCL